MDLDMDAELKQQQSEEVEKVEGKDPLILDHQSQSQPEVGTYKIYPRPPISFVALTALALRSCPSGQLPMTGIYKVIRDLFPHYEGNPYNWKSSIRNSLSKSNLFQKVPTAIHNQQADTKTWGLWRFNPNEVHTAENLVRWTFSDSNSEFKDILRAMKNPEDFAV
jgi:hypothetical protein